MSNITFNNNELHLQEHPQHEFLLSNKEVALGYGVKLNQLTQAKNNHSDELIEGKHWIKKVSATNGGNQKVIHWTKKGIVRLGFFIKSQQAKEFRDWAEDYIVNNTTEPTDKLHQTPSNHLRAEQTLSTKTTNRHQRTKRTTKRKCTPKSTTRTSSISRCNMESGEQRTQI